MENGIGLFFVEHVFVQTFHHLLHRQARAGKVDPDMMFGVECTAVADKNTAPSHIIQHFVHGLSSVFQPLSAIHQRNISAFIDCKFYSMEMSLTIILTVLHIAADISAQLVNPIGAAFISDVYKRQATERAHYHRRFR